MKMLISFCLFLFLLTTRSAISAKVDLTCEEFASEDLLYEGRYCTVTGITLGYSDQLECDTYPYYRQLVKVMKFTDCRMPYIPQGIFLYFDGIREFDISFTQLGSLHREFQGAKSLMYLTISHNQLTELSASLFVGATNLSVVDFSYNQLEKINPFAFADAQLMSRLHFSYNRIKALDKQVFAPLMVLDEIYLDNNELEEIDPELFAHNELLARVALNNNKLLRLGCDVFAKSNYLNKIDLSMNKLSEFNTDCIMGPYLDLIIHDNQLQNLTLRNVATVHASRNNISTILIQDGVSNLKSLKLANNSLSNVTAIFQHLSSLETLDLSFNYVGKLNISTFSKLTNLQYLYLESTNLSNINFGTFFHQKEMKTLDISYNNLNKINFDVFLPYLKNLETLYLDGNNLTEMDGLTKSLFPQLTILGISNNNFNCSYLSKLLRTLNWDELELSVDPELVHSNETHINGIACDYNTNDVIDNGTSLNYNQVLNDHYDHRYDLHKAILELLNPINNNITNNALNKSDSNVADQLDKLQKVHLVTAYREQMLESHLSTMKYLLAFICVACLAYVAAKFLVIYKANKRLKFDVAGCNGLYLQENGGQGIYQSTATMNTLQTNVAY